MAPDRRLVGLLWKFRAREPRGFSRWHWEAWTPSGQFVQRSAEDFETFTECENDAIACGYVPPEQRF
jgi:hypothetical protein